MVLAKHEGIDSWGKLIAVAIVAVGHESEIIHFFSKALQIINIIFFKAGPSQFKQIICNAVTGRS